VVGLPEQRRRAGWTSYATFQAIAQATDIQPPKLCEGKKGGTQTAVRELNLEVRPLLDELIVEKTTDSAAARSSPGTNTGHHALPAARRPGAMVIGAGLSARS
jgi:hypothetical protein